MIITIEQKVETVGWNTAMTTAPAEVVKSAKELAEEGFPVVMGKLIPHNLWCVVWFNSEGQGRIAYAHPTSSNEASTPPTT